MSTDAQHGFSPALLYRAARFYYEDDLSQQQIAERLGISRSTVSRLLKMARDSEVVRIEVIPPTESGALSEEVAEALGIARARVVPSQASRGVAASDSAEHLVEPAIEELDRLHLQSGDVLGVSWGNAVRRVAAASGALDLRGVDLVPVIGGLDETDPRFQTNEIVRLMGSLTGANVNFLHVPAVLTTSLRAMIAADPVIRRRLALWDGLSAAIVGVGANPRSVSAGPHLLQQDQKYLTAAVGDVCARYFTADGDPVTVPDEDDVLAIGRAQLRRVPAVIAVAAGAPKISAIIGAARAGLMSVLVTDSATAAGVLSTL